jgi:hypothetical protein
MHDRQAVGSRRAGPGYPTIRASAAIAGNHMWLDCHPTRLEIRYAEPGSLYLWHQTLISMQC